MFYNEHGLQKYRMSHFLHLVLNRRCLHRMGKLWMCLYVFKNTVILSQNTKANVIPHDWTPLIETHHIDFQFCSVSLMFFPFKLSVSRTSGQSRGFLREMSRTEMAWDGDVWFWSSYSWRGSIELLCHLVVVYFGAFWRMTAMHCGYFRVCVRMNSMYTVV